MKNDDRFYKQQDHLRGKNLLVQAVLIFVFAVIITTMSTCKKSSPQCPLQEYTIVCEERTWDAVFGGYDEGTTTSTIQANCPEDAQEKANDMSYHYGNIYKRCRVLE